jgi:cell wall-associated NlpC family hydrolase
MKKLITIGVITMSLALSGGPAVGEPRTAKAVATTTSSGLLEWLSEYKENQTLLEEQAAAAARAKAQEEARQEALTLNTARLNEVVQSVTDRVGKTRYVFSGSTPRGWDCSGLVLWMYGELGVTLEHRASKQQYAGRAVEHPKLGDVVVFKYNGRDSSYHVGIYLYPDTMVHAGGGRGDTTQIVSISKFAGKHSEVTFRRIIDTH